MSATSWVSTERRAWSSVIRRFSHVPRGTASHCNSKPFNNKPARGANESKSHGSPSRSLAHPKKKGLFVSVDTFPSFSSLHVSENGSDSRAMCDFVCALFRQSSSQEE